MRSIYAGKEQSTTNAWILEEGDQGNCSRKREESKKKKKKKNEKAVGNKIRLDLQKDSLLKSIVGWVSSWMSFHPRGW